MANIGTKVITAELSGMELMRHVRRSYLWTEIDKRQ